MEYFTPDIQTMIDFLIIYNLFLECSTTCKYFTLFGRIYNIYHLCGVRGIISGLKSRELSVVWWVTQLISPCESFILCLESLRLHAILALILEAYILFQSIGSFLSDLKLEISKIF